MTSQLQIRSNWMREWVQHILNTKQLKVKPTQPRYDHEPRAQHTFLKTGTGEQKVTQTLSSIPTADLGKYSLIRLLADIGSSTEHDAAIKRLLEKSDVDINFVGLDGIQYERLTALILAVKNRRLSIVKLLLDKGADANIGRHDNKTALIAAIYFEQETMVKLLLDNGADVNLVAEGSCGTALIAAILFWKQEKIVKLLLDRGADVNIVADGKYGTALIAAVHEKQEAMVKLLLNRGADANIIVSGSDETALIAAVREKQEAMVKLLLHRGADANIIVGGSGEIALIAAASQGQEAMVKLLLDNGADVNIVSYGHGTALIAAIHGKQESMVKLLLDNGADVNIIVGRMYGAALIVAIYSEQETMVKLLLDRGADVNIVAGGSYGTPLIAAIFWNLKQEKMVKLLLDRGADVNIVADGKYGTALIAAVSQTQEAIVKLLLDHGADVNIVANGIYATALIAALHKKQETVVKLLLDKGADTNMHGGCSTTCSGVPLITAVMTKQEKMVKLLLERGADANIVDCGTTWPGTALIVALQEKQETMVKLLLDKGADVNLMARDPSGRGFNSPLGAALWVYRGQSNLVSLLLERGADVNTVIDQFGSLLGRAALEDEEEIVVYLLELGADPLYVGGSYRTATGNYPSALDAARTPPPDYVLQQRPQLTRGEFGLVVIPLLSEVIDLHLQARSSLLMLGIIPRTQNLLVGLQDHDQHDTHVQATGNRRLGVSESLSLPPFPTPYTWSKCTPPGQPQTARDIDPQQLPPKSPGKPEGLALTPAQADLPCNALERTVLIDSLLSILGIPTEEAKHHWRWIENDAQYFVSHGYDFGLAYAAARLAWKNFHDPTFPVAVHRAHWLRKGIDIERSRINSIYCDETGQELIRSPYQIMPRRVWDLKSNRVVEYTMLHSHALVDHEFKNSNSLTPFSAITHSWTHDMEAVDTSINQFQWPVPLPRGLDLEILRKELLQYSNEYVWLDVLCLRQQSKNPNASLNAVQRNEWKLDVPTIGNVYRAADKLIRYFNGLGVPFSSEGWDSPRNWLRRAWTLQEIRTENRTINGGISRDGSGRRIMNSRGTVDGAHTTLRDALRPVLKLAEEVDSPDGCSVYGLAREMAKRHATQATDKVAGLLYLLRTTQLPTYDGEISEEGAWARCFHVLPFARKIEILFDFPYRGTETHWFPTWRQLMEWPEYNPRYEHTATTWSQTDQGRQPTSTNEHALFIRDIWAISHVHLFTTDEDDEYDIEFREDIHLRFVFYGPYQSQTPYQVDSTKTFTLATTHLGHSYNWVVCEVVGNQKIEGTEEESSEVVEFEVLKKIGVLRTDSCSELLALGTEEGGSFIQRINALFL